MVAAFDYCLHGRGGAAPSIDTAMHGLVDAAHVDHLHPDAGIALATAADGEELTASASATGWRGCRGGARASSWAWTSRRCRRPTREAIGVILGGHGITAWGATSERVRGATRWRSSGPRRPTSTSTAGPSRSGRSSAALAALPAAERRARAAAILPVIRGLACTDRPQVGHFTDARWCSTSWPGPKQPPLAALGTSCPDHFLRTKVRPLVLDLPPHRDRRGDPGPAARAARRVPGGLRGLLRAARRRRTRRRCAAPTRPSCSSPASACSPSAATSRPPGWPASSTSTRSTSCAAPRRCRRYAPIPSRRSSASSTGRWRRPSSPGCRSPGRWPPGSRW